jgi:hypothetical protein
MARAGMLTRSMAYEASVATTRWAVGEVPFSESAAVELEPDALDAPFVSGPWINPIKAGTATRVETGRIAALPMDYANPQRRAA